MTRAHDSMTAHLAHQPTPDDPAVTAARATVTLARARLLEARRAFIRRQAGASDVAAAEAQLSAALDRLEQANGNTP